MADTPNVGLIGLGNAGQALHAALSARRSLHVSDLDPARCAQAGEGAVHAPVVAASAAALAGAVDVLVLSLPMPEASLAVARDIAGQSRPGLLVVETSTVAPADVEAMAEVLAPGGARVIDAAIVGGVAKLAAGQGVFLVGPPEAECGAAAALLREIAEEIVFLNARGDGMRTKLVVNAVAHSAYVVLVEAGALALAQGIPFDVLAGLLQRESGLARPLTHRFSDRLRHHDFAGGMPTLNALKDSRLALEAARALGVETPAMAAAHGVYEQALAHGLGTLDYAALGTMWEQSLGISFAEG